MVRILNVKHASIPTTAELIRRNCKTGKCNVYLIRDYRYSSGRGRGEFFNFYRAMHFSAKRGLAIACRLSFNLSVTV